MEIYFDNSATTKPYDEVISEVSVAMKDFFGNPSSLHKLGIKSEKRLNKSREYLASTINGSKDEIYFTSGGSEANNLMLKGLLKPGHHLITTVFEHQSILKTCEELEGKGVEVTYLNVDENGMISLEDLKANIRKNTVLVSIMHVNNEMGSIQNIEQIGKLIKETSSRARFHIDAVQSYGKLPIDVKKMNIDMLSVAAHKIHGPKGIGFCYLKKGLVLNSLIKGGSQESGLRAGTENLPAVAGLQKAAEMTVTRINENYKLVWELKSYMIEKLNEIKDIRINSPQTKDYSPYILNVSFRGVRAEVLLHLLEAEYIYVSTGSACTSGTSGVQGSYVMKSLNLCGKDIESAIRFSFNSQNTKEEVDKTVEVLQKSLMFLRRGKR